MKRIKFVETNVPKNVRLRVRYLDHKHVVGLPKGIKRVTLASLYDTDSGKFFEAAATCGPEDNDNRKIGRAIAVGRALKEYYYNVAV